MTELSIQKMTDYRKWCIKLYIDVYKGSKFYREVIYDVEKQRWKYGVGLEDNEVDFQVIKRLALPIMIDQYLSSPYSSLDTSDANRIKQKSFRDLANAIHYSYFGPKFRRYAKDEWRMTL